MVTTHSLVSVSANNKKGEVIFKGFGEPANVDVPFSIRPMGRGSLGKSPRYLNSIATIDTI